MALLECRMMHDEFLVRARPDAEQQKYRVGAQTPSTDYVCVGTIRGHQIQDHPRGPPRLPIKQDHFAASVPKERLGYNQPGYDHPYAVLGGRRRIRAPPACKTGAVIYYKIRYATIRY